MVSKAYLDENISKCKHFDPDIRETSAINLAKAFDQGGVDEYTQGEICKAFAEQLTDKHTDVRANAVRNI
jgi:hypothetical protein